MKSYQNIYQPMDKPRSSGKKSLVIIYICFLIFMLFTILTYGQNQTRGTTDSLTFTINTATEADLYAKTTAIKRNLEGSVVSSNQEVTGDTYLWDFGDGAIPKTATGKGPFKIKYNNVGLKTVKLITYNPMENDSIIKTNYINVTALTPSTSYRFTFKGNRP